MAVGDLFYNKINCSTNNRAWSFGLWCEEVSPANPTNDAGVIARAVNAHLQTQLLAIINTESRMESVQSWRRHTTTARPGFVVLSGAAGSRIGDAMPNDNAIFINLRQEAQDAKYNGGIYIAGQSDDDCNGNDWFQVYLDGPVAAFAAVLPNFINAVGGDAGQWRFVTVSKTFVPPTTPVGSPFDITEATASTRVQSQRRRAQKVRGYATSQA